MKKIHEENFRCWWKYIHFLNNSSPLATHQEICRSSLTPGNTNRVLCGMEHLKIWTQTGDSRLH